MPDANKLRIREHFSSVQLTLLSIVVALILENLLGAYRDRPQPFLESVQAWLFWLQAALILASAVSMWAGFGLSLSMSSRQPNAVDFVAPFGLLIALNLAIGAMNPPMIVGFLVAAGAASLLASGILYFDARAAETRGAQSPFAAMLLQFTLALWSFAWAGLFAAGLAGPIAVCVAVAISVVAQFTGFWRTLVQWRHYT